MEELDSDVDVGKIPESVPDVGNPEIVPDVGRLDIVADVGRP